MEVTNVRLTKVYRNDNLKGIASIVLDNELAVHRIRITEEKGKLVISMPNETMIREKNMCVAHPIKNETREKIEKAILKEYEK